MATEPRKPRPAAHAQAHALAGALAGVIATATTFPLDLVKTKFQVQDGRADNGLPRYRSTVHAIRSVLRHQGVRGLYAGLNANLVGSGVSWGAYFLLYETCKEHLRASSGSEILGADAAFVAAIVSSAGVSLVTSPIWLVKTRMQMQLDMPPAMRYRGVADAFATIVRSEGVLGLYRGLVPSLFGSIHGGVQFVVYEELKKLAAAASAATGQPFAGLSVMEALGVGAVSKIVAAVVSYPFQVIRARLHIQREVLVEQRHYKGPLDTLRKTVSNEGFRGLYKGIVPTVVRVLPASCVTFVAYEQLSQLMVLLVASESASA